MPCSPAIHARSEFDLCHICGRTLAFCGVCSRVYARQTLRIGALRCLLSTCQTGVHPATRCASASLHIRSVSGCPETIPKVCPIRVLVLLGSVRPCSLPPVRILSCKTQKKKKPVPLMVLGAPVLQAPPRQKGRGAPLKPQRPAGSSPQGHQAPVLTGSTGFVYAAEHRNIVACSKSMTRQKPSPRACKQIPCMQLPMRYKSPSNMQAAPMHATTHALVNTQPPNVHAAPMHAATSPHACNHPCPILRHSPKPASSTHACKPCSSQHTASKRPRVCGCCWLPGSR